MLEDEIISCPVCDHDLNVKIHRSGKNITYLVSNDCPNCKTPANKIESLLNKSNRRSYVKTEESYFKKVPKGY
jgi:ssDNA-binding Zn-finger/Zn-ribbon topoisomerase 1